MNEWVQSFSDLITTQRAWSWSFIGILYVVLTQIIRGWLLRPIWSRAREIKRNWFREFQDLYLKRSVAGWFFYLASFALVMLFWVQKQLLPLDGFDLLALLTAVVLYVISLLSHVQAMGVAAVVILKKAETE
ncbi:MAG: hypothetical protein ACOY3K_07935 [Candidatus Omnitrophota bacterium]